MKKLNGIMPALLTPFDDNNKINEKSLAGLIEMNIAKGVDGFYVTGSTGEAFLLSKEERKGLMETVADIVDGRVTLIAQVGAISEDEAIEYAKHAEKCGYDAVSSVAPFYYKFGFDEIRHYYNGIAHATDLKMIIYNIPALSGVNMTCEQICDFLSDDKFAGIKFTSSDFFTLEKIKSAFPDKVVFNGYDEIFLSGLAAGADGGIGSTYNIAAERYIKIKKAFEARDMDAARKLQHEANIIVDELLKVGLNQAAKAILTMKGIPFGKCRAPFRELTAEQMKHVEKVLLPMIE